MLTALRMSAIALAMAFISITSPLPAFTQETPAPVIHDVTPFHGPIYENGPIYIVGENLQSTDGSCSVEISGLRAYPQGCSEDEIYTQVPWNASSGDLVVTADETQSNAFYIEIVPFEEGAPDADWVPGEIAVLMTPGADIEPILVQEGESPEAAEPIFENADESPLSDWYLVQVPPGEEIAKCRTYAMHPEVLTTEPNFIITLDDPVPPSSSATSSPTASPGSLPDTGGNPANGSYPVAVVLSAVVALLATAAVFFARLRP